MQQRADVAHALGAQAFEREFLSDCAARIREAVNRLLDLRGRQFFGAGITQIFMAYCSQLGVSLDGFPQTTPGRVFFHSSV